MRGPVAVGLGLVVACLGARAPAEELDWRPVTLHPPVPLHAGPPSRTPAAALGRPVVAGSPANPPAYHDRQVRPVSFSAAIAPPRPVIRAQGPDYRPMPAGPVASLNPTLAPEPAYSSSHYGTAPPAPAATTSAFGTPPPVAPDLGEPAAGGPCAGLFGWFGDKCNMFESDHAFDVFISPVTNPFLFEDPRSLTEIRPIFMYQSIPNDPFLLGGGNIYFVGTQARLHLNNCWSLVINKLGFITVDSGNELLFPSDTGFAEFDLGVKYTFLRNESTNTVGAVGLTFQIPTGSKAFQDTGDLSLVPYVSLAQNFWKTSWGSMNAMGTFGAALSVNDDRSSYLFGSLHLDYDIANLKRIYPLIELNWFHYVQSGPNLFTTGSEGRDLINFGSAGVDGESSVTLAAGVRYKFSEHAQLGVAAEFPITGQKDLLDFRLTVDFILRY